jgi:hypothetical protein
MDFQLINRRMSHHSWSSESRKQPWKEFCDQNSTEFKAAIDAAPAQTILTLLSFNMLRRIKVVSKLATGNQRKHFLVQGKESNMG